MVITRAVTDRAISVNYIVIVRITDCIVTAYYTKVTIRGLFCSDVLQSNITSVRNAGYFVLKVTFDIKSSDFLFNVKAIA